MEKAWGHFDDLVFDDSEWVEKHWIESVGVNVFLETFLSELFVGFGVIVDVGKGSTFFGVDVVFFSIVEDWEEFVLGESFFREFVIRAVDDFFGEDFFNAFDGLGFEVFLYFGMDKGYLFAGSDG